MKALRCCVVATWCCGLLAAPIAAAEIWQAATASAFAEGTLDGTALDAEGRIRLAPQSETLWGPEPGIVWDVAVDRDGAVFVALSGPGRLLRVIDGKVEVWFDGDAETLVTAVAVDGDGGVFCGLSPKGSVLQMSRAGVIEREFGTESKFIWDLAADRGRFWAATGLPGSVLYNPGGDAWEMRFDSGDDPVRALFRGRDAVYAGTGGRGRLVRLGDDGSDFVVLDADEPEIVGVSGGQDGTIYALAAAAAKRVASTSRAASATPRSANNSVTVTAEPPKNGDDDAGGSGNGGESAPRGRSATNPPQQRLRSSAGGVLYRVAPGGDVRAIWRTSREMPFDLAVRAGALMVATGDSGHLIEIDDEGRDSRLLRIPSSQASAIATAGDGTIYLGGTTDARLVRVMPGDRREGHYDSAAIDAGAPARWGRVDWQAAGQSGRIVGSVRVGNTDEPDATWSDWVRLERRETHWSVPTSLPSTRRLQVRLELQAAGGSSPQLSGLDVYYAPANRPPQIETVTVLPAGIAWVRASAQSSSSGGPWIADDPVTRELGAAIRNSPRRGSVRRYYEPGIVTLTWSAADPDKDRLRARLEVRRDGEALWSPVAHDLADDFYSWDARGLPDGRYRLRLTVRDGLDNVAAAALDDVEISEPFDLDWTRPQITDWNARRSGEGVRLDFTAEDPGGGIATVEIALNGADWQRLAPVDGVADGVRERYELELDATELQPWPQAVRVRVTDRSGNVGGALHPFVDRR